MGGEHTALFVLTQANLVFSGFCFRVRRRHRSRRSGPAEQCTGTEASKNGSDSCRTPRECVPSHRTGRHPSLRARRCRVAPGREGEECLSDRSRGLSHQTSTAAGCSGADMTAQTCSVARPVAGDEEPRGNGTSSLKAAFTQAFTRVCLTLWSSPPVQTSQCKYRHAVVIDRGTREHDLRLMKMKSAKMIRSVQDEQLLVR